MGSMFSSSAASNSKARPQVRSLVDNLTQDQLDEFYAAFKTFDKDGSDSIDIEELRKLLESVGQFPTDDELLNMIKIVDADGTGDMSFAEFVTLMAHNMPDDKAISHAVREAFEVFDTSGDGLIQPSEIQRIMMNVGEPVTLDDIEEVVKKADLDNDGVVSYDEFAEVMLSGFSKGGKVRLSP
mmetsp:Transcript_3029/g.8455  ORF Transcript_3029/g.8455 Transcript_3029/m.8455 type:complete len:183 (+) Transcript_3029:194-742(+)